MDLREYSEQVSKELEKVEDESLEDILKCQQGIAELCREISASSNILGSLEEMLTSFQTDLGSISGEIKALQDQSLSMSISLNNRKKLEQKLDNYLKQITVSPDLVQNICNKPVDEDYLSFVNELREKMRYFRTEGRVDIEGQQLTAISMQEILPELEKLRSKAAAKIRGFLLSHIQNLTKPKTNVQLIQESVLIKYKDLLVFLREASQETYVEVCMTYTETLSQVYLYHFKVYLASLKKLIKDTTSKHDVVVSDATDPKNHYVQGFDLKDRHSIVDQIETLDPIVSHTARKSNQKFHLERVFQSLCRLLVDTATFNFLFVLEFFSIKPEQYQSVFGEVFSKTFQHIIDTLASLFSGTHDLLALLLILKINSTFQQTMEKRGIQFMNSFFEKVRMILWPKLQHLLDTNLREMEKASYLRTNDLGPFFVTYRFSQLIVSLLKVFPSDDMFIQRLSLFKKAFVSLLQRLSQEIKDEKNRVVFLINNLEYLVEELHNLENSLEDFNQLEVDLNELVETYIELQLKEVFGGFMEEHIKTDPETLIQDFNANWRKGVQMVETLEKDLFFSEETQKDILRRTYAKFLMKYNSFTDNIKKTHPHLAKNLVSQHTIMAEIQR